MPESKKTAVVICPGRGTYNRGELGYLLRHHADRQELIGMVDDHRRRHDQATVTALDAATSFDLATYWRGDNASPLIFTCSLADFLAIDRDAFEIVAVTGNSMGWYTALACAGALAHEDAIAVVNTMGRLTHEGLIGGQLVHTLVDEEWRRIPGRREALFGAMETIADEGEDLSISIELGGLLVFAGSDRGLDLLAKRTPAGPGRFPMRLPHHGAFHSPLMAQVSARAKTALQLSWFKNPLLPMIDGRGAIWRPRATDAAALWAYTLGTQVVDTYDFTAAVCVAVREFAPDHLVVLGPGDTLGGAVAQALIACAWRDFDSKTAFTSSQERAPFVLSMGREDQRARAVRAREAADPSQGASP